MWAYIDSPIETLQAFWEDLQNVKDTIIGFNSDRFKEAAGYPELRFKGGCYEDDPYKIMRLLADEIYMRKYMEPVQRAFDTALRRAGSGAFRLVLSLRDGTQVKRYYDTDRGCGPSVRAFIGKFANHVNSVSVGTPHFVTVNGEQVKEWRYYTEHVVIH